MASGAFRNLQKLLSENKEVAVSVQSAQIRFIIQLTPYLMFCLLYTSDAADE